MSSSLGKIVLVRPRNPNNIGAAARAMKNFGLTELAVVTPHPPVWEETVSAVNATDVMRNARVVGSIAEAVADCTLVIGTADRTRFEPKQTIFTPADLNRELQGTNHRLALVFGSEKHGLTNEDLSHCHRMMSIPTQPDCPSMNLGQAVAVCCYELARDQRPFAISVSDATPAMAGEIEIALQLALEVLCLSQFIYPDQESDWTLRLRRNLLQFNLTERQVNTLCGALRKIRDRLVNQSLQGNSAT